MQRILCGCVLGCWVVSTPLTGWSQTTMPVPDTGQTTCYDAAGTVIDCPSPGEPFHGQDGNYTINAPSYTDLGNGVVRDNVTGLHWEVKTNKNGAPNYDDPRDADNTYTWCDTNPLTNNGVIGTCSDHDTMDFIAALNTANHGGFDDWRMPTVQELLAIADYGQHNPAINTSFFPNTAGSRYWSSTKNASYPESSLYVDFLSGYDGGSYKSTAYHVRAVRGGLPPADSLYVDHGDGTVTDTVTWLMWQQETAPGTMTWEQALAYCEDSTLGGHSDWRLPTIRELSSLVDRNRHVPAINLTYFPQTQSADYWASTTVANSPEISWGVYFYWGSAVDRDLKTANYYVRMVRGGQPIIVSPTSGLTTTESGGTATFTLVLGAQPTADVTIDLSSSDPGEGTVLPTSLTFTAANWNVPQTVTVTGVDDGTADGDRACTIIIEPAVSTDPNYNGINPPDVSVTNTDEGVPTNTSPVFFPVRGQDGKTGIFFID